MRFVWSFTFIYQFVLTGLSLGALYASGLPLGAKIGMTAALLLLLNQISNLALSLLNAGQLQHDLLHRGLLHLDSGEAGTGEFRKVLEEMRQQRELTADGGRPEALVLAAESVVMLVAGGLGYLMFTLVRA